MSGSQRIVRVRRQYNQWVANQTLEDFALRFTAERARKWSPLRVGHTALAAISFLALEAIGGAITLNYGFTNAALAILVVSALIFLTGLPISYYAAKYGVDIDLLTRGAGFGYIGSTVTSLIYASFTFIFFAIEAAIMALALEMVFGLPLALGYIVSSIAVIPLVTHGITWITRFQTWTQPLWVLLHILPFAFIFFANPQSLQNWTNFPDDHGGGFNILLFGAAASVVFSLVAQIGEQVDVLRFLPRERKGNRFRWWISLVTAGAGWVGPGALKMLLGSFLAVLAVSHGYDFEQAAQPTDMYLVAFSYVTHSPGAALGLMGLFVVLSQLKINVTNAYAGSIAWSNFFSRLTHSHPGRVVWLVFNVAIALLLMELGIYRALEQTLGLYSVVAVAWVGALVADLVVNKPLGLSPKHIEFKRAHLYDINPVGVGAMVLASASALLAFGGTFGEVPQALAPFIALGTAFVAAPALALLTRGRYYLARKPREDWGGALQVQCCVCEHHFETQDMAGCPVYSGPICSLCCTLDARCGDRCKPHGRVYEQISAVMHATLPAHIADHLNSGIGRFVGVFLLSAGTIATALALVYFQATVNAADQKNIIAHTLWVVFFILLIISGIASWLFVLAHESRRVAEQESASQTRLLLQEIEAHEETDVQLQKARDVAEAANQAKSRYVMGIGHELRTPLNAILGYAQLMERDEFMPAHRRGGVRVIRRSAEHLSGLIDGLLDISRIESGRLQLSRDEVRLPEFLDQIVEMFRLQASAKDLQFRFKRPEHIPAVISSDEKRLRQILINLLSNAIKFTSSGQIALRLTIRSGVAEFEIADTGPGIPEEDVERVFAPFERGHGLDPDTTPGIGLGLTITKLLTEIMGGEILLKSTPGKGTTFTVRLLLSAVADPLLDLRPHRRIAGYTGERRTIIVADDDAAHRDLMREVLVPLGFVLLTASDGASCIALAEECEPDLFLLDIAMPGMDGMETAKRLRAAGHERAAIVMVSANMTATKAQNPDDAHDDLIPKPVDLQKLLDSIENLLGLEWTYETSQKKKVLQIAPKIYALAQNHVEELKRLAGIGYIRGIQAKLAEIETQSPESKGLVDDLNVHVRNFDLRRFVAVLEAIPGE
ncbi:hybrid sensor histidine kinase/response regulator [Terrihabitans soli]|uniref:histidine kinase n=1 Tax=Terrihabitans soli TaxID=708113 RepID=A0A6S6QTI4_9HYPH|nr:ATP-binding protein [Terrihabitans soli]BCJ90582.1 hybrid sensor histidine kinase/response regulator [Terrihabitans soli]